MAEEKRPVDGFRRRGQRAQARRRSEASGEVPIPQPNRKQPPFWAAVFMLTSRFQKNTCHTVPWRNMDVTFDIVQNKISTNIVIYSTVYSKLLVIVFIIQLEMGEKRW